MTAKSIAGWQPSELFLNLSVVRSCKIIRSMKRPDKSVCFGSDVKEFVGEDCDGELSAYMSTTRSNRKRRLAVLCQLLPWHNGRYLSETFAAWLSSSACVFFRLSPCSGVLEKRKAAGA
jgi:hypothetical protein